MKQKILFCTVIVIAVNCIGCAQTADNKISENSKSRVMAIGNN